MKKQTENQENNDFSVKDLSIEELIPNTFDNCIVTIFEGHHTLDMPVTMTGMVFSNWLKTKGGIFSKDVFRHTHNKLTVGKYVLFNGYNKKFIARLITEDERLLFESLNLIDGYFKDVPYMILKYLDKDHNLTSVKRYIIETEELQNEVVVPIIIPLDEEEPIVYNSVSLFND
ncbi:MAG: hypothetical protein WC554_09685 [Clostridia bacterium]